MISRERVKRIKNTRQLGRERCSLALMGLVMFTSAGFFVFFLLVCLGLFLVLFLWFLVCFLFDFRLFVFVF